MSERQYPFIIEPEIKRHPPPVRKSVEWATPPVPLIGLPGVDHQWEDMQKQELFGTFVDKPAWTLVPNNWREIYPPWKIEMLTKTYITPTYIREFRLVEVDYEAFRKLCFDKDRKVMAWYLDFYGKSPEIRLKQLEYWMEKWGEPYKEEGD